MKDKHFIVNLQKILRINYGKNIKTASIKEMYDAVGKNMMALIDEKWKESKESTEKRVGYLSAEFLIGRLIYSNMINMKIYDFLSKEFAKYRIDFNQFEEVEDAALGNGGLGRLAACFLDSAATQNKRVDGFGIRYKYGLFKQNFIDGFQNEEADDWLKWGDPFSKRIDDEKVKVNFADYSVYAVPYDTAIIGYKNKLINTLRLYQCEPIVGFDFKVFDSMNGNDTAINNFNAHKISAVLYPNDNTQEGKELRLRQQYFMVSASIQNVVSKYLKHSDDLTKLDEYIVFQLNDTHPTLGIPELIRVLMENGLLFDEAINVARRVFNFTNHTILQEALEKWPLLLIKKVIPDIAKIIVKLDDVMKIELKDEKYFIIKDGLVHMANLAIYASSHVNGVAKIHSDILINDTFNDWYNIYPEKFLNVTNGITPRRWLLLNNPKLAKLITKYIGENWIVELDDLKKLDAFKNDEDFINEFIKIKYENKHILKEYINHHDGIEVDENSIFDIQIKRLHEYKRQLLNALSILYMYFEIKEGGLNDLKPITFIFGAKSAPGYYMSKAIIKFINEIAYLVNNDIEIDGRLKVVFVENYNVSYAEKLVCACDYSEQISMAGMEASGTGNMKFMLNGTPTIGTMDGANVEICQEAGVENNYIFGARVEDIKSIKENYNPKLVVENDSKLKRVVDTLIDGTFNDQGTGVLRSIYDSLMNVDYYLVLEDFRSYIDTKIAAFLEFGTLEYYKKCIENMINAGKFSSDRSILNYSEKIWKI